VHEHRHHTGTADICIPQKVEKKKKSKSKTAKGVIRYHALKESMFHLGTCEDEWSSLARSSLERQYKNVYISGSEKKLNFCQGKTFS